MEDLVKLPGVGRKTANVVLGHALGVPGLPVDRHVLRVSNRIGIARGDDPEIVEQQLSAALPAAKLTVTSDTLILHGRRICKPRPLCDRCAVRDECNYYRSLMGAVARPRSAAKTGKAAKARKTQSPVKNRRESGSLPKVRRAAKRRGTGRGGAASAAADQPAAATASLAEAKRRRGAPRQTK
jgi:adenine-specific DNA glycosylase